MNKQQTYTRLLPVFARMNKSLTCTAMTDNGDDTYTFDCEYTKWAIAGHNVTILGNSYTITEVEPNVSLTVSGTIVPTVLTFDLYAGYFKHGTVKKVAEEIGTKNFQNDRLPLNFLHETVNEAVNFDVEDSIETNSTCTFYFLTSCNFQDWTQSDGDTLANIPMRAFCREFVLALSRSTDIIGELKNTADVRNYHVAGLSQDNGGTVKNVFNEYLAGVSLRLTIPFLRNCDCTGSALDTRCAPGYVLNQAGDAIAILYSNETYTVVPSAGSVNIIDQDDNVIDTVNAGNDYQVTVFDGVRDTVTANVTTIIDNII